MRAMRCVRSALCAQGLALTSVLGHCHCSCLGFARAAEVRAGSAPPGAAFAFGLGVRLLRFRLRACFRRARMMGMAMMRTAARSGGARVRTPVSRPSGSVAR